MRASKMAASFAFGAGIGEKTLLQVAWSDLRDLFSKRNNVFGGEKRRSVLQPGDLRAHPCWKSSDLQWPTETVRMPAEEIEILVAFHVPEVLHFAAVCHQGLLEVVGH